MEVTWKFAEGVDIRTLPPLRCRVEFGKTGVWNLLSGWTVFAPEAPAPPITVTDLTPATEYVFRVGVAWASDAGKPIAQYSASSVGVTTMTVAEEEEAARKKEAEAQAEAKERAERLRLSELETTARKAKLEKSACAG